MHPTLGSDSSLASGGAAAAAVGMLAVFHRPRPLFRRLREHPTWLAPMVAAIAVGILAIVALPDAVFVEGMQGATTRRGAPVDITSAPDVVARWERMRLSLGAAFTLPVKALMLSGLLLAAFSRIGGGTADLSRYFAATSHTLLIGALGALVALALQLATGDPTAATDLAAAVPGLSGLGMPGRALGLVNPFTVWMLAVLGIGVAELNRRPAAAPIALLVGGYAALLAVLAGFGAA
jgi:hypothetical protein